MGWVLSGEMGLTSRCRSPCCSRLGWGRSRGTRASDGAVAWKRI